MGKLRQRLFGTKKLKPKFATRKYRLMRHSRSIAREVLASCAVFSAIGITALVMILLFNFTISSPYFRIRETVVRGCRELTEKDVLTLAAIKPSATILSLNMEAVRRRIMANPWVKDVLIGREFPDRIVVEIRERAALALLEQKDGFHLIDADGADFKKLESGDEIDVPVLTGCVREGKPDSLLLPKAIELLRCLLASTAFPAGSISEIHGDETFGLSLFTTTGLCLQLGFDCYENKLKRLVPVVADLQRNNLNKGFLQIDLCDPTKITIQRKGVTPSGQAKRIRQATRTI